MWHEERLLIDGNLVAAEAGNTFETVDPSTGKVLGTAADASVGDAQRAVAAARRAFGEPPSRDTPASLVRSTAGRTIVILDREAAAGLRA